MQKTHSKKVLAIRSILFISLPLIFSGCMTPSPSQENKANTQPSIALPKGYTPPTVQQLTFAGENSSSRFSPDGKRMLYISRARPHHAHGQIYELDLKRQKDRRVTYHDGDNAGPSYHPDGKKVLYASSTDEIKENPAFLQKALAELSQQQKKDAAEGSQKKVAKPPGWNLAPFEIYSSRVDGRRIRRLTESQAYDSEPSMSPDGKIVIFTSVRTGNLDLFRMDLDGQNVSKWANSTHPEGEAVFSPSGEQVVWVQYSSDMKNSQIWVGDLEGKNKAAITTADGLHWGPRWHPDGKQVVFSSNRDDRNNYEIYVIKTNGTCLRRLTFDLSNDTFPDIDPTGKRLTFTSDRSGTNQVYVMDFSPPQACPPQP